MRRPKTIEPKQETVTIKRFNELQAENDQLKAELAAIKGRQVSVTTAPKSREASSVEQNSEDYHERQIRLKAESIIAEREAARNRSIEARVKFATITDPKARVEFFAANKA